MGYEGISFRKLLENGTSDLLPSQNHRCKSRHNQGGGIQPLTSFSTYFFSFLKPDVYQVDFLLIFLCSFFFYFFQYNYLPVILIVTLQRKNALEVTSYFFSHAK